MAEDKKQVVLASIIVVVAIVGVILLVNNFNITGGVESTTGSTVFSERYGQETTWQEYRRANLIDEDDTIAEVEAEWGVTCEDTCEAYFADTDNWNGAYFVKKSTSWCAMALNKKDDGTRVVAACNEDSYSTCESCESTTADICICKAKMSYEN